MLKKPGTESQDWRIPRTWLGAWIGFIIILASVLAATAGAQDPPPTGRRPANSVVMDSARIARLYVSNKPEDLPQADFERQITAK